MGHGPARELGGEKKSDRTLAKADHDRLAAAMQRLDAADAEFKTNRDDARHAQRVKLWIATSKEMDAHLRELGNMMHEAAQLSLDVGSDGGGAQIKPFLEESSRKWDRLYFKLEGGDIVATFMNNELGRIPLTEVSFEFCEKAAVDWLVAAVDAPKKK